MPQTLSSTGSAPGLAYRHGVLLVLLAGACWSTMGLGIRQMEVANVWQILFYRSCALTPFLFLIIGWRSQGRPLTVIRRAGPVAAIGGIGLVFAFSGGIYAIQTTTVANAMFLFASAPFAAALLGWLLLREKVRQATWWAMAVAAVGIAIMVIEGIELGHGVGNMAALASALGFAAFTIVLRWGKLSDMMPSVLWSGVFAIGVAGIVCSLEGHSLAIPWNDILIALAMGIFQVGLGLALYTHGSTAVPAAELALLSMTEVLLGPLWVWLFLGETAAFYTLLGGGILMAALVGNALSGLRRPTTPMM
ncbi:MAG: DMT family transporter [Pseudomonadota bacterium]